MRCLMTRAWLVFHADEGAEPTAAVRQHAGQCAACRDRFALYARVISGLSAGAAGVRVPPPPFLAGRIEAALERPATRRSEPVWLRPALALGVVGLAVILVGYGHPLRLVASRPPRDFSGWVQKTLPHPGVALPDAAQWAAAARAVDQPLTTELDRLRTDATNVWLALRSDLVLAIR